MRTPLRLRQQGSGDSPFFRGSNNGQDLFRSGFDSSWEIDVFGGVRRSVESADATVEATIEDRRDVLVTLLGDIARNYIDLRGFQRRLAVAGNNLKAQQESLEIIRVRFQAGLASDLQVAQAEAQVNTTAAEIPALEALSKQAAHRLDVLLGIQPGALWAELSPEAPIPALPPQARVGLPSELLRRRPDIRRAERQLAAANGRDRRCDGRSIPQVFPFRRLWRNQHFRERLVFSAKPLLVHWPDHSLARVRRRENPRQH